jgi:small subunit ribosomal protein S7
MPRRLKIKKRERVPDPKYKEVLVTTFINSLMKKGKRSTAQNIFYGAMDLIEKKGGKPSLELFHKAMENVKPLMEVKARRVGGATYQIPVEIRADRKISLGIRWIIQSAKSRKGKGMEEKLSAELLDAVKKEGAAVKKRNDTHRMAEANKAFAHYRW